MTNDDGLNRLREDFPPSKISKLPKPTTKDGKKGNCSECGSYHRLPAVHLDYVGHAALTDRLLDCDPSWNWQPVAFDDNGLPLMDSIGGLWIRLTVCGVTRLGYGDPGVDFRGQRKTGPDGIKEAVGDALRNAAMRFGAALSLWHKGELHPPESSPKAQKKDEPATDKTRFQIYLDKMSSAKKAVGDQAYYAFLLTIPGPDGRAVGYEHANQITTVKRQDFALSGLRDLWNHQEADKALEGEK